MECLDKFLFSDITKPCTPSTQLHPPPPSSLQHPHQYSNQNIARNWAIFSKLDRKIQSCPFWLKIGIHGILEVLIPFLKFLKFRPQKVIFGQIWAQKVQVNCFAWKLSQMVYQGCWFLFRHQFSEFKNLNSVLGKFSSKKSNYPFLLKIGTQSVMRMLNLIPTLVFSNSKPKSPGCWFLFWD